MVIQCVAIVVLSVCVALMAWVLWLCLPELVEITKQRRQPKAPAPKRNDKPAPVKDGEPFKLGREHRVAVQKRRRDQKRWGGDTVSHYQRRL